MVARRTRLSYRHGAGAARPAGRAGMAATLTLLPVWQGASGSIPAGLWYFTGSRMRHIP